MADYTPLTSSVGALVAICTQCTGVMTQRINATRLKVFLAEIEVTIKSAPEPIKGSA